MSKTNLTFYQKIFFLSVFIRENLWLKFPNLLPDKLRGGFFSDALCFER